MDIHTFMTNYREAFGERAELPIAFWYSDKQENETEKARNEYVYIRGFKADHEDAARGGRLSVGPGTGS